MSFSITTNLPAFKDVIKKGEIIDINRKGEWYLEGIVARFIRLIFLGENARLIRIASVFNKSMDQFEKLSKTKTPEEIKIIYNNCRIIHESLSSSLKTIENQSVKKKLLEMDRRIAAFSYRAFQGTQSEEVTVPEKLKNLALSWKHAQDIYIKKELDPLEEEKLKEVSVYPEFLKVLYRKESKELRDSFFKWALRDNCDVKAFVLFPSTSEKVKKCYLGARVGRFNLKLIEEKDGKYDYCLPFEVFKKNTLAVKSYSILDETKKLTLNKGFQATIGEIIASIGNRNNAPGNFEFVGKRYLNGKLLGPRIINYNSFELSPVNFSPLKKGYDAVTLLNENWWDEIPPVDIIAKKDVKKWYGIEPGKKGEWIIATRATREGNELDFDKSHGFTDVLIPNDKNEFEIYSFGKYAEEWPSELFDKLLFLTNTVKGKIESPDENHFMPQRQHAVSSQNVTAEEGKKYMNQIREDLITAYQGKSIFQFGWQNCAQWVQSLMHKMNISQSDYFLTRLVDVQTNKEPINSLLKFCRILKGRVQATALRIIRWLLLSNRGVFIHNEKNRVTQHLSLEKSGHPKEDKIFLPAMLHEKIKKKDIRGIIYTGNMGLNQLSD